MGACGFYNVPSNTAGGDENTNDANIAKTEDISAKIIDNTRHIEKITVHLTSFPAVTLSSLNEREKTYLNILTEYFISLPLKEVGLKYPQIRLRDAFSFQYDNGSDIVISYIKDEQTLYKCIDVEEDIYIAYEIKDSDYCPYLFTLDMLTKKSRDDKEYAEKMSSIVPVSVKDGHIMFPSSKIVSIKIVKRIPGTLEGEDAFSYKYNSVRYELNEDIERIKKFFEELVLIFPNEEPGKTNGLEVNEICFYFDNDTYTKMHICSTMKSPHLQIDGKYYEIGQEQYEGLIGIISWQK